LQPGEEILLSTLEHHSNLVPWQKLAERRGLVLRFLPMTPEGRLERVRQLDEGFGSIGAVLGLNGFAEIRKGRLALVLDELCDRNALRSTT
jgi:hypothetical protein